MSTPVSSARPSAASNWPLAAAVAAPPLPAGPARDAHRAGPGVRGQTYVSSLLAKLPAVYQVFAASGGRADGLALRTVRRALRPPDGATQG